MRSIFVCVPMLLTELEVVAYNHLAPHRKLFNGIRWGEKVKGCADE